MCYFLQFIGEVVNRTSLNNCLEGKCILDRLYSHLLPSAENEENGILATTNQSTKNEPMDLDEENDPTNNSNSFIPHHQFEVKRRRGVLKSLTDEGHSESTENTETIGQHLQKCFQYFRAFFNDGITKMWVLFSMKLFSQAINHENLGIPFHNSFSLLLVFISHSIPLQEAKNLVKLLSQPNPSIILQIHFPPTLFHFYTK